MSEFDPFDPSTWPDNDSDNSDESDAPDLNPFHPANWGPGGASPYAGAFQTDDRPSDELEAREATDGVGVFDPFDPSTFPDSGSSEETSTTTAGLGRLEIALAVGAVIGLGYLATRGS
jgi:hypothetical protein